VSGRLTAARRRLSRALDPEARAQAVDRRLVALEQRVCTERLGRLVAAAFGDLVPNHGHRIRTAPPSVSPQAKASILLGLYERREIELLRRHLRPELDVIEAGASLGVTGAVVASQLRAGRRLVAVEANPELVPELRSNLAAAGGDDRAVAVHAALAYVPSAAGPEPGRAAFVPGADSVLGSVRNDLAAGDPVEALTLDDLRRRWAFDRYALICDIEGGEWELINQPPGVFVGCEQLFVELHDRPDEDGSSALLRRLTDVHGFVPVARRGPVHYLVLRGTDEHVANGSPARQRAALVGAALGVAALVAWRRFRRRP
jgi:FkbM family methyltransferase